MLNSSFFYATNLELVLLHIHQFYYWKSHKKSQNVLFIQIHTAPLDQQLITMHHRIKLVFILVSLSSRPVLYDVTQAITQCMFQLDCLKFISGKIVLVLSRLMQIFLRTRSRAVATTVYWSIVPTENVNSSIKFVIKSTLSIFMIHELVNITCNWLYYF